jgi:hypothetical protein
VNDRSDEPKRGEELVASRQGMNRLRHLLILSLFVMSSTASRAETPPGEALVLTTPRTGSEANEFDRPIPSPFRKRFQLLRVSLLAGSEGSAQRGKRSPTAARVQLGNRSAELNGVLAIPIHWTQPRGKEFAALELDIFYKREALEFIRLEKTRKNVAARVVVEFFGDAALDKPIGYPPGSGSSEKAQESSISGSTPDLAAELSGRIRVRIESALSEQRKPIEEGLVAFLLLRVRPDARPGITRIVGKVVAAAEEAGDRIEVSGGEVTILAPRVSEQEENINPYTASGCFFYMH